MDTGGLEYNTQYIMSVGKTHSTARLIFHVSESPKSANQSNYCVVTEDRQRKKSVGSEIFSVMNQIGSTDHDFLTAYFSNIREDSSLEF